MSKNLTDVWADEFTEPKEKLIAEMKQMVSDAEELLSATASQTGEIATLARSRIQNSLKVVKNRLHAAEASVLTHTREGAKAADQFVHANPWQSIGISACAGVIVGMLIKRQ
jgi:ElaB/YqjD/DUF883 family membrane-anchored ribosome-binding protein